LKNGDVIAIDAIKGTIAVELSKSELAARKRKWKPRQTMYASGALWRYAQTVGSALTGATTHPGAKAEKHVYAEI
jgi:dihydroxy-acid dehydratase